MELIIYLEDQKDLALLEPLLKRLQFRYEWKAFSKLSTSTLVDADAQSSKKKLEIDRNKLQQMHKDHQVNALYYGDPVAWQRTQRSDRQF